MKVALDGGAPVKLVSDEGYPSSIAVDATSVYWTSCSGDTVSKAPLDGGSPTLLASGQGCPIAIAVYGAYVYWLNSGPGAVMRVPVDGGRTEMLASPDGPNCIAVDSTNVYWGNLSNAGSDGAVMKVPITGGDPVMLAGGQPDVWSIAVDSANVYWTALGASVAVMRVPIDGGAPVAVVSTELTLYGIAVDASGLYYGTGTWGLLDGALHKVALGGGIATALVSGERNDPFVIATDSTSIYWASGWSGKGNGVVMRLAK
jgi:sugar lactone lactonase YvrE